jgi:hypothetical protein
VSYKTLLCCSSLQHAVLIHTLHPRLFTAPHDTVSQYTPELQAEQCSCTSLVSAVASLHSSRRMAIITCARHCLVLLDNMVILVDLCLRTNANAQAESTAVSSSSSNGVTSICCVLVLT